MPSIPKKLDFITGQLADPLGAWCDSTGKSPSEALRLALAAFLGVDAPQVAPKPPRKGRAVKSLDQLATEFAQWANTSHEVFGYVTRPGLSWLEIYPDASIHIVLEVVGDKQIYAEVTRPQLAELLAGKLSNIAWAIA